MYLGAGFILLHGIFLGPLTAGAPSCRPELRQSVEERLVCSLCNIQDPCHLLLYTDGMWVIHAPSIRLILTTLYSGELKTLSLLRKARMGMWKPSSLSETRMLKLVQGIRLWPRLIARLA